MFSLIEEGDLFRIKKISIDSSATQSPPPNISLEIVGFLIDEAKVGDPLFVSQVSRNGERIWGVFRSSKIHKIEGNRFHTCNSIYEFEKLTLTDDEKSDIVFGGN